MADRYWIATGSVKNANTASYWNTAADGSGSTGVPTTNDTVIFGHDDSFTNDLGTAPCRWDLAVTLTRFQSNAQHYKDLSVVSSTISFNSTGNVISMGNEGFNPVELGFKVGMEVTITGSTSNNITFLISALDDVSITSASSLTTEAAGNEVTITYSPYIDVNAAVTTTRLDLDTHFKNTGSAIVWTFSGTYPASNTYIFNGDNAKISNKDVITFSINSTGNGTTGMYFTEGPYPKVSLTGSGSRFTPQAVSTGSTTHAFVEMESLSIGSGVLFQPNGVADLRNDAKKIFKINTTSSISLQCDTFDAGLATFEFVMDSGGAGFEIPCSGSSTYGAADKTFVAKWSGLILSTDSAGFKGYIPTNRTLAVSSIHVKEDASLVPQSSDANSTLVSISRPRIDGAWSFKQLTDGVYVSLMSDAFAVTPSDGPAGRVQLSDDAGAFSSDGKLKWDATQSELVVNGKLTVTGLIDPTGLELTPVGSNPGGTAANTLWLNSGDSNKLYHGSSEVGGGGGGGSGTVTSVAVTGSDGIEVDSGSPITTSGTIALGVNAVNLRSHINVANGATAYADSDAIAAVEGEATLTLSSGVTVGTDLKMTTSSDNAIIENVTQDKDIIFKVNDGGSSTEVMRIDGDVSRVGIGTDSPQNTLHVKTTQTTGDAAYAARFQTAEGNVAITRYGGIHIDNDNTSPFDGAAWSTQRWQISQRDTDHFDIAYGTPTNTNVGVSDTDFRITNTGNVGIGLGNTNPSQKLHVNGTIRQTGSTSSVLVSDSNGDITSASNLQDLTYLQQGQAETDAFTPTGISGPHWAGAPPNTIQEAIERIAAHVGLNIGPIP